MFSGSFLEVSNSTPFFKKHLLKCEVGWDHTLYCCQVGKQGSLPPLGCQPRRPRTQHSDTMLVKNNMDPTGNAPVRSFVSYVALWARRENMGVGGCPFKFDRFQLQGRQNMCYQCFGLGVAGS